MVSLIALGCICLCSVGPQLSGTFTHSVLLIVFSFGRCLPVTTVFHHAVRAQPCCDTDFLNSAGVTVAQLLVSSQKRTRFSFSNKQTLPSLIKAWGVFTGPTLGGLLPLKTLWKYSTAFILRLMFPLDICHLMVTADSSVFTEWKFFKPLGITNGDLSKHCDCYCGFTPPPHRNVHFIYTYLGSRFSFIQVVTHYHVI